jgi:hypothetical protein
MTARKQRIVLSLSEVEYARICGLASVGRLTLQEAIKRELFGPAERTEKLCKSWPRCRCIAQGTSAKCNESQAVYYP